MKVARPVWSGGKGGDSFKTLTITIFFVYKNAERGGYLTDGRTEKFGYVYEMPVHG